MLVDLSGMTLAIFTEIDLFSHTHSTQIQSILSVASTIESCGAPLSAEYLRHDLDTEIKLCMVDVLKVGSLF
jgi:hypothetical protein